MTSPRHSKEELLARASELEQTSQALERRLEMVQEEAQRLRGELGRCHADKGRLAAENERLEMLAKLDRPVHSLNLDKIVEACITRVPYLLNAHAASIYLFDPATGKLHLKRHSHRRALEHVIDLGEREGSLMAQVVRSRKVRVFEDLDLVRLPVGEAAGGAAGGAAASTKRPHREQYESRSCIVAPLALGDRVLGVLNLSDPIDGKPFSEGDDYRLVAQVAEMLALGIANCQRFAELEARAQADSLTRLVNHQTFFDVLAKELRRAARYGGDLTVVMLDVDAFKVTNDNAGHLAGDLVLREVASLIQQSVRISDTAARYGGDEFAIILPQSDLAAASVVAERIRERVAAHVILFEGRELRSRVSLGLAQFEDGLTPSELVRLADQALYRAKREGGDRIGIHEPTPEAKARAAARAPRKRSGKAGKAAKDARKKP